MRHVAQERTRNRAKLTDYLLSPSHPVGRFKARFFSRLGFRADAWEEIEQALREQHGLVANAEAGEPEAFGQPFTIRAILRGPNGVAAPVVSVWFGGRELTRAHATATDEDPEEEAASWPPNSSRVSWTYSASCARLSVFRFP